ncbi:hypothetical protein BGX27_000839 [Mortierella sp. AM989]|nr:hypothetical protein BGX27_000839 [Mortierella sp. AM989]
MPSSKVIVIFKSGTSEGDINAAVQKIQAEGGTIGHRYNSALLGFSAEIPDSSLQSLTTGNTQIDYIEGDGEVSIYAEGILAKKS